MLAKSLIPVEMYEVKREQMLFELEFKRMEASYRAEESAARQKEVDANAAVAQATVKKIQMESELLSIRAKAELAVQRKRLRDEGAWDHSVCSRPASHPQAIPKNERAYSEPVGTYCLNEWNVT